MHSPRLLLLLALSAISSFASGYLAQDLKALYTIEACYQQERDAFSRDFSAIEYVPSSRVSGLWVDSLAANFWVGFDWKDGMLRAVRLESGVVGPLGWSDTAVVPSMRQILSGNLTAAARDTTLSGRTLRLWSRTSGDTLWNLVLDTSSLEILGLRRVAGTQEFLGLDTLPRELFVCGPAFKDAQAVVAQAESDVQEFDSFPDMASLEKMTSSSGFVRIWQRNSHNDSALLVVFDPASSDFALWSSGTQIRALSTRDRSAFAAGIRLRLDSALSGKASLPGLDQGWSAKRDTLRIGDSVLTLNVVAFRHGDTAVALALDRDGLSGFGRLVTPAGNVDLGLAMPASDVPVARRTCKPVTAQPGVDILGRSRSGHYLGTTPLPLK